MPLQEEGWPSEITPQHSEESEYAHLCRILAGLRRLSSSEETPPTGLSLFRDTAKLVDAIQATQCHLGVLAIQLQDGTATAEDQRKVADRTEELLDLLQSHAADSESGVVPAPRQLHLTERRPA
ncbi:hypothetical protein Amsp01_048740 [Amycolatopsis sp. NBRC 101858]|nr:hypothetical protein Amsp01_048740 [Amycolatopsis sp. NBRC 101858]